MGRIGVMELLLILVVILLLFGAQRLPDIGAALGKAVREFKKGMSGENESEQKSSSSNKS